MNKGKKFRIIWILAGIICLFNLYILLSGKTFFYNALIYNFANIDDYKIFPGRKIHRSSNPQPWPLSGSYNRTPIPESLKKELEELGSVAFLIIKDDSLVHETYWDNYGKDSYSNSFSVAKSYVSCLTGIA